LTIANLDALMAATYSSKADLTTASLPAKLTVAEAAYAHSHHGSYAGISDTFANISSGDQATVAAAKTVFVTGPLLAADMDTLLATR
jgi:hypothetical protein